MMTKEELENNLKNFQRYYLRKKLEKEYFENELKNLKNTYEESEINQLRMEKILELFHSISTFSREQSKIQIENIVTSCLKMIFEEDIDFKIELTEQRGRMNADFLVSDWIYDKKYYYKPELSRGGGVVDIISIALRIAFLLKYAHEKKGPIILDEPAKHLSEEYIFNLSEFLKQISKEFNRQIILVTHNQHLSSIGNYTYRIEKHNGKSIVANFNQLDSTLD